MNPCLGFHEIHYFHGTEFPLKGMTRTIINTSKCSHDLKKRKFLISVKPATENHLYKISKHFEAQRHFMVKDKIFEHAFIELKDEQTYSSFSCELQKYHLNNQLESRRYFISNPRVVSNLVNVLKKLDLKPSIKGEFNKKRLLKDIIYDKVHCKEEPRIDDRDIIHIPGAYERIVYMREYLKIEHLSEEITFRPIRVARHGWPALCALVYNFWHKAKFNRDNFPINTRPLHIYLYG